MRQGALYVSWSSAPMPRIAWCLRRAGTPWGPMYCCERGNVMAFLADKLGALYTERADLLERIQSEMRAPDLAERVKAAAMSPARGTAAMAELFMAAAPTQVAV